MSGKFFDEMSEQSLVKATIVARYFVRWAHIMINTQKSNAKRYGKREDKIAYIDLFAGPGRYKAGSESTPLKVLSTAITDQDIRERLITIFNDRDIENVMSLQREIAALPDISKLRYPPKVMNHEVGEEIVKLFEQHRLVPTLFFVDPFGYKGLSLRLINSVLQNWGCDCIFFFNYNRINMGLSNDAVEDHMNALFGRNEADLLREQLTILSPDEREFAIVEQLAKSLKNMGGEYVLPFCFRSAKGTRTTHHLIFVSKNFKGYEEMKSVMAGESSLHEQGVPSFDYNPATERQPLLFELARPLDDLASMLLNEYAGQTLTMQEIYQRHSIGRRFIKKNYREVLLRLETEGRITTSDHRKNTFAEIVQVTFPAKS